MNKQKPIVGITMGDPVGIGPEIILSGLKDPEIYKICRPCVFGDISILESAKQYIKTDHKINQIESPEYGKYQYGHIDIINLSKLNPENISLGSPDVSTGKAMINYITHSIDMAIENKIDSIVTCPINKTAMQIAGSKFHGHTELFAQKTNTTNYAMMMAGKKLKVILVTIHISLKEVPEKISIENICKTINITNNSLIERFGINKPKIAVAGLNPHSGEEGMFGDEEQKIIQPAIDIAAQQGINIKGPIPPDTVFYHAANGYFDAVVCMYHDQGLIPFKMIHFEDGVNTTLGLPIIRTSVDHGTAYDIVGQGKANPKSLIEAIKMAAYQSVNKRNIK